MLYDKVDNRISPKIYQVVENKQLASVVTDFEYKYEELFDFISKCFFKIGYSFVKFITNEENDCVLFNANQFVIKMYSDDYLMTIIQNGDNESIEIWLKENNEYEKYYDEFVNLIELYRNIKRVCDDWFSCVYFIFSD